MEEQERRVERTKRIWWATISLVFSLAGCTFIALVFFNHWPHTWLFPDYDPRNYSRTKAPQWYKGKITRGVVYKAGVWKDGPLLLIVAVESEQADNIDVYMEAVGDERLSGDERPSEEQTSD
ncbi:MAG TPA: hypothetical protein VMX13_05960 [Sedimentisphaerales bacterium]|nr:hypothetical protein [Sedimentisphaerales bacterium]